MSAPPPGHPRIDPRYVQAWSRLASVALGRPVPADPARLVPPTDPSVLEQVRTNAAHAEFTRLLTAGAPLEQATYRGVAALTAALQPDAAWALTEAVRRLPSGEVAAHIGRIVLRHRQAQFDRAWELAEGLDDDVLAAHLPVEAIDGALASDRTGARERIASIVATPQRFPDPVLVDLAGRLLVAGERAHAYALMAELRSRPEPDLSLRARASARHIEAALARAPKPVPAGAVPFAILDYQSPDQDAASQNLGDYVQTLALLGNLARFSDVRFTGEDGLGTLVSELQLQVRDDLRIADRQGALHLLDVNREFSSGDAVPPETWTIAFGWHMHPLYRRVCDFPYHPNLRPIFVAFHVNYAAMLDDAGIAYLRKYGPIGCRDWTTVDLLLSRGVDAFFTGCLTPTIDAIFPERADVSDGDGPVGVIDLPRAAAGPGADDAVVLSHAVDDYREMSLVDAMRTARALLTERQALFSRVVTSRLHAYLPFVALGVPVEFRPHRPGDVRFPGLTGMTPGSPPLRRMQRTVRDLLADVLGLLLAGASERDVYARWRELTADRVARARERFAEVSDPPQTSILPSIDVAAAVAETRAAARRFRPERDDEDRTPTDVVLWVDAERAEPATVLITSIVANTSEPVRLWLLTRDVPDGWEQRLGALFPATTITVLPLDHVAAPARVEARTADRLLIPELLSEVDRAVYLDVATLVLGDLAELFRLDLDGHPLAARDSHLAANREWRRAASPLPQRRANEWLRSMMAGQPFDAPALDSAVLVLDLKRLRADGFTATWLAQAEQYGLDTPTALLGYTGPDRCRLQRRWNAMLLREDVADPAIVHWTGAKPWDPVLTPAQERWDDYAGGRPGHRMPSGLVLAGSRRLNGS
jgi:lipopolysaccharide biosynthesis glycosyltransferase